MAANLNPTSKAVQPAILDVVNEAVKEFPPGFAETPDGKKQMKLIKLLLETAEHPAGRSRARSQPPR